MALPPVNNFAFGIFITFMLCSGMYARPESRAYYPEMDIPQYIMDETETMDEAVYSDMKKYPGNNPTFMAKWPYLRDVLPPNYADEDEEIPERIPTPLPLKKITTAKNKKDHAKKKNIVYGKGYYMQPCPFKICTMGRKRDARYLQY